MARALVVCPATEDLEMIEFVDSPLGVLIHACSRFRPVTALACGRACAQKGRCDLGQSDAPFEIDEEDDTQLQLDVVPEIAASIDEG